MAHVDSSVALLSPSFDPNALVGGVPFCTSSTLGTVLCYPPSYLLKAYNFPESNGDPWLNGAGQTIVIVDAYGSPTISQDLQTFDTTFGLPPAHLTILCGPTWTNDSECPVTTVGDLTTAPNATMCGAPGWAAETTLDVTMSHALAPGANIVLVVANDCTDASIYGAELSVVTQPQYAGSIMSQSFGEPDDLVTCTTANSTSCLAYNASLLDLPDEVFQTATANHWTVIASSGDDGANEDAAVLGTIELTPSFPATNPLVLAAGGTMGSPYGGEYGTFPGPNATQSCAAGVTCDTGLVVINGGTNGCGTAARPGVPSSCVPIGYGGEQTWNEFNTFGGLAGTGLGRSSGGGISALYPVPFYQTFLPRTETTLLGETVAVTGRATPDVSFNAAAQGGWLAYLGFISAWGVFSGTSAASPAWAAIMALVDQANGAPVGFINPEIYALGYLAGSSVFNDVHQGNNSVTAGPVNVNGTLIPVDGYVATHGYDLTTGWGTPNVQNLVYGLVALVKGVSVFTSLASGPAAGAAAGLSHSVLAIGPETICWEPGVSSPLPAVSSGCPMGAFQLTETSGGGTGAATAAAASSAIMPSVSPSTVPGVIAVYSQSSSGNSRSGARVMGFTALTVTG
jgi:subtilase family serine protease